MRPKISQSLIVLKSKDEKTRDEKTLDRIRNDVMNLQREINLKKTVDFREAVFKRWVLDRRVQRGA